MKQTPALSTCNRALLFGATGAIGQKVCALLQQVGWTIIALTRQPGLTASSGIEWRFGALPDVSITDGNIDVIISCGPLDLFSLWYAQTEMNCARVVAFSSTSVHVKQSSPEQRERDLAERLQQAEARLIAAAASRAATVTILRPTLIYGSAMDRNISRIASIAHRYGFFLLPDDALGLRQPVHVDDLARAAIAVLQRGTGDAASYDLPGGETISYREMTARILAGVQPPAKLVIVPGPLFNFIARVARLLGIHDAGMAVLERMRQNLVFDDSAARSELGYDPRPFNVDASMLNHR